MQAARLGMSGREERLWEIAHRLFSPERTYTPQHIRTKLELYLGVSPERAERGLQAMIDAGTLTATFGGSNQYYLSDTTPF